MIHIANGRPVFKPFTLDEIQAITGIQPKILDAWVPAVLPLKFGDEGTQGLDFMQTFGVFVGWRYLEEGAEPGRAVAVASFIGRLTLDYLKAEMQAGRSFAALRHFGAECDCLVKAPPTTLGKRLCLRQLFVEFRDRLNRVYPDDPKPEENP